MMRLLVLLIGTLLAAAILFQAAAFAQTAGPALGGSYFGTIDGEGDGCSTGSVYAGPETGLYVNREGTSVIGLELTDLVTPLGNFTSFDVLIDVPINDDGSFDQTFDPLNLGLTIIHLDGQFDGETVSGNFSSQPPDGPGCAGTFAMAWVPPPPRTYWGSVGSSESGCGNGNAAVTVSGDRLSVIEIVVDFLDEDGVLHAASATFDEGSVPVAEDGSFGWVYFPGSDLGQEIAVLGRVGPARLSGGVTLSPSTCGAMPFVVGVPTSLGQGGSGGAGSATGVSLGWALAAGAFGLAALAAGAALRWRVR